MMKYRMLVIHLHFDLDGHLFHLLLKIHLIKIYLHLNKIYYKLEGHAPDYISEGLKECSDMVSALDQKMLLLNESIHEYLESIDKEDND